MVCEKNIWGWGDCDDRATLAMAGEKQKQHNINKFKRIYT